MPNPTLSLARNALLVSALALTACGPTELRVPEPRPLVITSGARLNATEPELLEIYRWVRDATENIDLDPSFLISSEATSADVYPWESLQVTIVEQGQDTASYQIRRSASDAREVYNIYAWLHLMGERGELDEWAPELVGLDGFELESGIVERIADAWLLGRASFDFAPYELMDEILWAHQEGWLDAYLLMLRGYEFPEALDAWRAEDPDGEEEFLDWYRETFDKEFDAGL